MPKRDKLKEELGWLKIVFGIFIATNLSLIAWFVQKYMTLRYILKYFKWCSNHSCYGCSDFYQKNCIQKN